MFELGKNSAFSKQELQRKDKSRQRAGGEQCDQIVLLFNGHGHKFADKSSPKLWLLFELFC